MSTRGHALSPARRRQISRQMRAYHARKRADRAMREHLLAKDTDVIEANRDASIIANTDRFPFRAYDQVTIEAATIVHDRDRRARNSYEPFYAQFPHGVSDALFECRRRTSRVLGVEQAVHNGHGGCFNDPTAKELVETLRSDLLDLMNYAVFAVLLLDKAVKE